MIKYTFAILLLFAVCSLSAQQDNLFTQFAYNKLSFNPGVAGENQYTTITGIYRDQWSGLAGSPQSQMLTVNFPTLFNQLGFGLSLNRSEVGIQNKTDISGMYAYRVNIAETSTSVGLLLNVRNFVNDFTRPDLMAVDGFELDPAIARIKYSTTNFNVGIGAYHKAKNYYLGFSIPRMIKSNIDDDAYNINATEVRHIYAMAGVKKALSLEWEFYPQLLFKYSENAPYDLDALALFTYRDQFHCGLNFRTGGTQKSFIESVDLIVGFNFNKRIFGSIAYDFTTTELREFENGSFELLIKYSFNKDTSPSEIQNPRYFK